MDNKELNCRFWFDGYCLHKYAPKSDISCIGKKACIAWQDSIEFFSDDNYKTANKLLRTRQS